jgi:multidrug efflux pump subunit AcrA (membrane-fusion protein)
MRANPNTHGIRVPTNDSCTARQRLQSVMSTAVDRHPMTFAGLPGSSWAFAIRIWLAIVVALYAGFWLELESASTAATTVAILALPTRGQVLGKAIFQLIATVLGVTASITIVGTFAQTEALLLGAFAAWLGLCVYVVGLRDGYRAYAAALSGYTVAIVAVEQIDTPQHLFESGIARGAAIAIGVLSVAIVNDLLAAPDHHPNLAAKLGSLRRRVANYARCILGGETVPATTTAALLGEVVALRPEINSLATELDSGPTRSAAARSAMVEVVAELFAIRVLEMLLAAVPTALRERIVAGLATTAEEQQIFAGTAVQAKAALDMAQQQLAQAEINLRRTRIRSPVNGYVTNFLMRVGDFARAGTSNISVIDADSFWIDGYFEETKLASICVRDRAEAKLMGYSQPIVGHVGTVTRGISVSNSASGTQGLPNVDPVYTWVRLAQRVPVRIVIDQVPPGVPLVSGMTATVTLRRAIEDDHPKWSDRLRRVIEDPLIDLFTGPQPRPDCQPVMTIPQAHVDAIPAESAPEAMSPDQINPGLAPGMNLSPR